MWLLLLDILILNEIIKTGGYRINYNFNYFAKKCYEYAGYNI